MKDFKRSNLPIAKVIKRTTAEIEAYDVAMEKFVEKMNEVRAVSITKSSRSLLSAAKTILNK